MHWQHETSLSTLDCHSREHYSVLIVSERINVIIHLILLIMMGWNYSSLICHHLTSKEGLVSDGKDVYWLPWCNNHMCVWLYA